MSRHQLEKLKVGYSTKGERRFSELLKKLRIPFITKAIIQGREVDFIIGKYAIEIDGHFQDSSKNIMLIREGYSPIHLPNWFNQKEVEEWLKKICQI